jgi:hypothetical protein
MTLALTLQTMSNCDKLCQFKYESPISAGVRFPFCFQNFEVQPLRIQIRMELLLPQLKDSLKDLLPD